MDQKSQSTSWGAADKAAFYDTCKAVDEVFNKYGLDRCEKLFPATGLSRSSHVALAYIKHTNYGDELIKPMRFVVRFDPKLGLRRYLEQTLTKPMQFGVAGAPGFFYEVTPRTDVKIAKLVVNLSDLDRAVEELIAEANRYYFLYCYPLT